MFDQQYFAYNGVRYEYESLKDEDRRTGLILELPNGEFVYVEKWMPVGHRPMKVIEAPANISGTPRVASASVCMHSLVRKFTMPKSGNDWAKEIKKAKSRRVLVAVRLKFQEDVLAHTDQALRQYIVSEIVSNPEDWGRFKIIDFRLAGYSVPNMVHIEGWLGYNTKVK